MAYESIEITPSDHPDRGWRLSNLGLQLGRRYECMGNPEDLKEAIEMSHKSIEITPSNHPDRVWRLSNFGFMHQRALAKCEKSLGPDNTFTLDLVGSLGILYFHQGKLKEAEEMYQRALTGNEKTLGPDNISTLNIAIKLGDLFSDQGRLKEAKETYQ